jgi:cytidylate kinase
MPSIPPRSGTQDLVEQQILRWQEQQRERRAEEKAEEKPPPVITISREAWARGTQLGALVAKHLGYDFWDQEVVHRIAEETGASENFLRALDEHARGVVEDVVAGVLAGDKFTRSEYMSHLLRVTHAIARYGRAIIIGRGAQFALPRDSALRVRVVCPVEQRTQNFARARGLGEKEARIEIERIERDRRAFIQQQFKADVTDPCHYDLVVNAGRLTLEQGAAVIERAYEARFPRA